MTRVTLLIIGVEEVSITTLRLACVLLQQREVRVDEAFSALVGSVLAVLTWSFTSQTP